MDSRPARRLFTVRAGPGGPAPADPERPALRPEQVAARLRSRFAPFAEEVTQNKGNIIVLIGVQTLQREFLSWINRLFKKKLESEPTPRVPEISPSKAEALLRMLDKAQAVEPCCEDVHNLLDHFTEIAARGEDTHRLMPQVHLHMELCPDCQEEFEALLRILQTATESP